MARAKIRHTLNRRTRALDNRSPAQCESAPPAWNFRPENFPTRQTWAVRPARHLSSRQSRYNGNSASSRRNSAANARGRAVRVVSAADQPQKLLSSLQFLPRSRAQPRSRARSSPEFASLPRPCESPRPLPWRTQPWRQSARPFLHEAPRKDRQDKDQRPRAKAKVLWSPPTTVPLPRRKFLALQSPRAARPSQKIRRRNPRPPSDPSESAASSLFSPAREPAAQLSAISKYLPSTAFQSPAASVTAVAR